MSPESRLASRLVELTPAGLEHVFFADSGSVSVEVAIKMCLQYWRGQGYSERRRLLTVRGGYHGDTFGAMAVCDPVGGMHSLFRGTLVEHVFADRPPPGFAAPLDEGYAEHLRETVARHAHELAAVIVEPVVQGAGGMHFYSPTVVTTLRELCDRYDLLLVLDEIATGFGRTGALFAADHAGGTAGRHDASERRSPAAICRWPRRSVTRRVAKAISEGEGGALMHGPTYMANPLACAVALASIELLDQGKAGSRTWRGSSGGSPRDWRRRASSMASATCACSARSA